MRLSSISIGLAPWCLKSLSISARLKIFIVYMSLFPSCLQKKSDSVLKGVRYKAEAHDIFVAKTQNGQAGCHATLFSNKFAITPHLPQCNSKSLFFYSPQEPVKEIKIVKNTTIESSIRNIALDILELETAVNNVVLPRFSVSENTGSFEENIIFAYERSNTRFESGHPFTLRAKSAYQKGLSQGVRKFNIATKNMIKGFDPNHLLGAPIVLNNFKEREVSLRSIIVGQENVNCDIVKLEALDLYDFWQNSVPLGMPFKNFLVNYGDSAPEI